VNPAGLLKNLNGNMCAQPIMHRICTLSTESASAFTIFSSDSLIDFDRWSGRFNDLVDFHGKNWDEADKIARLKTCLDGPLRRVFDGLKPNEKDTLAHAIKSLRASLDSPQRRELTYHALAVCKQREGESVREFLNRLIPLVDASTVSFTPEAREETLCRALLEKLHPNIGFLLKATTLASKRVFESLCIQAQEAEIMLASAGNPIHSPITLPQSSNLCIQAQEAEIMLASAGNPIHSPITLPQSSNSELVRSIFPVDFPNDNFATWKGNDPNSRYGNQPSYDEYSPRGPPTFNSFQDEAADEQQMNARPFCDYCERIGHWESGCRQRKRDMKGNQNANIPNTDDQATSADTAKNLATEIQKLEANLAQIKIALPANSKHGVNSTQVSVTNTQAGNKAEQARISSWESPSPSTSSSYSYYD
jgi:hypothetical protein